jgi:hypothetical protein
MANGIFDVETMIALERQKRYKNAQNSVPVSAEGLLQGINFGGQSPMGSGAAPQPVITPKPAFVPPAEKLGMMDRIRSGLKDPATMAGLAAAFNQMTLNPNAQLQKRASDLMALRTVRNQANQTVEILRKSDDPTARQVADMIEANPDNASAIYQAYVTSTLRDPKDTFVTMTGAQLAEKGREGFIPESLYSVNTVTQEIKPIAGQKGAETFGTTVRTYTEGDTVIPYVTSNYGNIKRINLPEGATVSAGLTEVDMGTSTALINDQGSVVKMIPKNISAVAGQKEIGTVDIRNAMEEEVDAKNRVTMLENHRAKLVKLLKDPAKLNAIQSRVGAMQGKFPALTSGQSLGESFIDQVKGQTFLRAFESIKGGGQITETEGAAATAALNRLNNINLSDEDYVAAMKEAAAEMQDLIDLEKAKIYEKQQKLSKFRDGSTQVTERIVP